MPKEDMVELDEKAEKKRLAEEKKKLKADEKAQKKEVRARAKEIEKQEEKLDSDNDSGGASVFLVTLGIVILWLGILALLVKLDVGGFGSGVLTPILKDVPIINKILPSGSELAVEQTEEESYDGYSNLREAVDYIRELELQLEQALASQGVNAEELEQLRAEVERLKEFEDRQVEFQRIKDEFYEEVVYSDKGPGPEAYQKYFEAIDPANAEVLYRQVVQQLEETQEIQEWASAYSAMKPAAAAAIFEAMTDDLDRAARILGVMNADSRGQILGAMSADIAAQLTKIMDPES